MAGGDGIHTRLLGGVVAGVVVVVVVVVVIIIIIIITNLALSNQLLARPRA